MPELPDVQVFKEYLDATSLHKEIESAEVDDAGRMLDDDVSPRTLVSRLEGTELTETRRHGKHLFVRAGEGGGWLRLHFGMTGELHAWSRGGSAPDPEYVALRLDFADGSHLVYSNRRTFGEIGWVDEVDAFIEEQGLGPDPLAADFGLDRFRDVLDGRRGRIKTTLMNQEVLGGLGNVYVDEILFQVGLHPETATDELDGDTVEKLHRAMDRVIGTAVQARAEVEDLPDSFLLRHRKEGETCPKCGGEIEKTEVGGRPTYLCSRHQGEAP